MHMQPMRMQPGVRRSDIICRACWAPQASDVADLRNIVSLLGCFMEHNISQVRAGWKSKKLLLNCRSPTLKSPGQLRHLATVAEFMSVLHLRYVSTGNFQHCFHVPAWKYTVLMSTSDVHTRHVFLAEYVSVCMGDDFCILGHFVIDSPCFM